jgi:hypothetical protein
MEEVEICNLSPCKNQSILSDLGATPYKRNFKVDPILIPQNSIYSRWMSIDKLFDGKFSSGNSTPLSPHTPANFDKRRRSIPGSIRNTQYEKENIDLGSSNGPIKEMNWEDDSWLGRDIGVFTPTLRNRDSYVNDMSRYEQDFEQLEFLGKGNFGTVYKCMHKLDGLLYAIKQIKLNPRNVHTKEKALQEAYTLAISSMNNDNAYVIRYYGVWIENDILYMCTELCESTLPDYVHQNGVTEKVIRKIMRDVLKGLAKMHESNVVHLDIKPDNIMLSYNKKFKLADLGLARITTNLVDDITEGDSRYLAPEMLQIMSDYYIPDLTKSDIFSVAASFLELIWGRPLPGNGQEWHRIRNGDIEFPDGYSEELKDVIKLMLANRAEDRPSAEELLSTVFISEDQREIRRLRQELDELREMVNSNPRKVRKLSV